MDANRVLGALELNNGVLNHAAASKLARAGWRLDESTVRHGALAAAVSAHANERLSDLPSSRMAALVAACRPVEDLKMQIGEVQAWAAGGHMRGLNCSRMCRRW